MALPPAPKIHPLNTHPTLTRAEDGIVQPRLHLTLLVTHVEPATYKQALVIPEWFTATQTEYDALMKNDIWSWWKAVKIQGTLNPGLLLASAGNTTPSGRQSRYKGLLTLACCLPQLTTLLPSPSQGSVM
ncbi:hypothetical protein KIW84_040791 [Lathyrus oleraceus]|uniref:Uncharacterized protein n=1 Tax=Pisum sativum TaxID=3888 RepID=A0A9D4X886_PEA|nr:hypothetical protein KIW84_040791 [Pisum sativum]